MRESAVRERYSWDSAMVVVFLLLGGLLAEDCKELLRNTYDIKSNLIMCIDNNIWYRFENA